MATESKNVFITGASSGIGKEVAQCFATRGWNVAINARREAVLNEIKQQLMGAGKHLVCVGDYSQPETYESAAKQIKTQWNGKLNAVVNCAGVFESTSLVDTPLEKWEQAFNLMVRGGLLATRLGVQFMACKTTTSNCEQWAGGKIVHVTSIHDGRGERNSSAYSMAKAALGQMVRVGAIELADFGICINAIAPGFIKTPMSVVNGVDETEGEWFKANYVSGHHLPLKRPGLPNEIAPLAFFLAGVEANYITGQTFTVDGGLTVTF
jgi:NAD(P)-dependent dehydrogenase (short-subunit alcohol dehydrogenase family)